MTLHDLKSIFLTKIREMVTELETMHLPLGVSLQVDFVARDEILVEDVMEEPDKNVFYIKVRVR